MICSKYNEIVLSFFISLLIYRINLHLKKKFLILKLSISNNVCTLLNASDHEQNFSRYKFLFIIQSVKSSGCGDCLN